MIVTENAPVNVSDAVGRENVTPAWACAVTSFPPSDRILSTILTRQAERYGERVLLVAGETRWSFAQTAAIAAASAQTLVDAGIRPGDRVALMCSNRPEFLQVYLGCAWLGAIAVPINTALRGFQLSHIFRNSRPALLVVEAQFVDAIESVEAGVDLPPRTWIVGAAAGAVDARLSAVPLPALGAAAPAGAVRPGDTVAILYTSGTTGPAKGVCCPQAQLFWWGIYSARALGIREGDVLFTTLPLFHTNALNAFYQALLNGCNLRAGAEILRVRILGGRATAQCDGRLSARRDGVDAAGAAEECERQGASSSRCAWRRRAAANPRSVPRAVWRAAG
ncbi:acyl-CoA synthetase (AMP-forming)/AMP-acid ligase II [Bradyrhizobium sp. S3.14.4]